MKKILLLFILLSPLLANAQNYQCLQSGVKHYFINESNYLRGIRIDSTTTISDTVIYYPYRSERTSSSYITDTTGSWLGEKVVQYPDGTFVFDNTLGDTVFIKTQDTVGNTWLFFSDTASNTYMASIVSIDTMTILGSLDSVKTILVRSYHSGAFDTTDPVNNLSMILSKNHGFISVFSLYTFPFYSHDSSASSVIAYDGYLPFVGEYGAFISSQIFNIVDYHMPTMLNMYNFNVGDMFAGYYGTYTYCEADHINEYTHYDSIISKVVIDSFHTDYTIHRQELGTSTYYYTGGSSSSPIYDDYIYILHADTSLVFLKLMPEEYPISQFAYFYYPSDTTFCFNSPYYKMISPRVFEGCPTEADFKTGFLNVYDTCGCSVAAACESDYIGYTDITTDIMYFALKNDNSCGGVLLPPLRVNELTPVKSLDIFPNPVQNEINVKASYKVKSVIIFDLLGKVLYDKTSNEESVKINITDLPTGVYFIKINGTEVRKFIKE